MLLFTGKKEGKLDAKFRVTIPSDFRDILSQYKMMIQGKEETRFYLSRHPQNKPCLVAITPPELAVRLAMVEELPPDSPEAEYLALYYGSLSEPVTLDSAGRIQMSEEIWRSVGIERDVSFLGTLKTFQIWNPVLYANQTATSSSEINPTGDLNAVHRAAMEKYGVR